MQGMTQLLLYRHGRSDPRYVLPYNYVCHPIPPDSIASAERCMAEPWR